MVEAASDHWRDRAVWQPSCALAFWKAAVPWPSVGSCGHTRSPPGRSRDGPQSGVVNRSWASDLRPVVVPRWRTAAESVLAVVARRGRQLRRQGEGGIPEYPCGVLARDRAPRVVRQRLPFRSEPPGDLIGRVPVGHDSTLGVGIKARSTCAPVGHDTGSSPDSSNLVVRMTAAATVDSGSGQVAATSRAHSNQGFRLLAQKLQDHPIAPVEI